MSKGDQLWDAALRGEVALESVIEEVFRADFHEALARHGVPADKIEAGVEALMQRLAVYDAFIPPLEELIEMGELVQDASV